jgi:hypothetical protein
MIYITWSKHENQMKIDSSKIGSFFMDCSCVVRNELNGWRPNPKKHPLDEVVYGITHDNEQSSVPVMPRQIPNGIWNIIWIETRINEYQRPFVIMTDAHQDLDIWELDSFGRYVRKTGKKFDDWMYGIHLSSSRTTQGCIRALNERYFFILADLVGEDHIKKEEMKIEVTE